MNRCKWVNLNNLDYINYHDKEWGILNKDEHYLYEMFILETFQSGLSWEIVFNKKVYFENSYDNFNIDKIIKYDNKKIEELHNNKNIIRNKLKIKASINNSIIYKNICLEYGSFYNYLINFTNGNIYYNINKITNELSDRISFDLRKKGMKFVGSITIYAFLQAIGIINDHDVNCFLHHK